MSYTRSYVPAAQSCVCRPPHGVFFSPAICLPAHAYPRATVHGAVTMPPFLPQPWNRCLAPFHPPPSAAPFNEPALPALLPPAGDSLPPRRQRRCVGLFLQAGGTRAPYSCPRPSAAHHPYLRPQVQAYTTAGDMISSVLLSTGRCRLLPMLHPHVLSQIH